MATITQPGVPGKSDGTRFNFPEYYGKVIPIGFGRREVDGTIIYDAPRKSIISADGKTEDVTLTFAVSLGYPTTELGRSGSRITKLWIEDVLVLDKGSTDLTTRHPKLKFTVYNGTETQLPNATLEAIEGAGNVPAFRGMMYVIFKDFPLTKFGVSGTPKVRAEIMDRATTFAVVQPFTNDLEVAGWEPHFERPIVDRKHQRVILIGRNAGQEGFDVRVWDMRTRKEIARHSLTDTAMDARKFIGNGAGYTPGAVLNGPWHATAPNVGANPLWLYPEFTGGPLEFGSQDIFHIMPSGNIMVPVRKNLVNNPEMGIIDPMSGRMLAKTQRINVPDFIATVDMGGSTNSPLQDATQLGLGTAQAPPQFELWVTVTVSMLFGGTDMVHIWGVNMTENGQPMLVHHSDAWNRRNDEYATVPGSGAAVALVPNRRVPGALDNYVYLARGQRIHALHINCNPFSEVRSDIIAPLWSTLHDFGATVAIQHMVRDDTDGDLFCTLYDSATLKYGTAKIRAYHGADQ